jgi:hypothetical protein
MIPSRTLATRSHASTADLSVSKMSFQRITIIGSIYLQGIDPEEIIETFHARRPPMIPASIELAPL